MNKVCTVNHNYSAAQGMLLWLVGMHIEVWFLYPYWIKYQAVKKNCSLALLWVPTNRTTNEEVMKEHVVLTSTSMSSDRANNSVEYCARSVYTKLPSINSVLSPHWQLGSL